MRLRQTSVEGRAAELAIDVVAHSSLTVDDVAGLRRLFDAEYQQGFGDWDPDLPYGYAPHDFHIVARQGGKIVGHVGWARRAIRVGDREMVIAGVGGVMVSYRARGERLGGRLMNRAEESMTDAGGISFGYLGCREEVVSFYTVCGWTRIFAAERSIGRAGQPVFDPPGQPLLVLPIEHRLASWPGGEVDLRGRAW
jgi:aminoglycoside 2'-N-acetyltransferase I